ncbi:hypothetical protein CQW49_22510 (plasmid) [Methylosinus trichosporium OB3b]|uniref:Uncharacterized protein n=1 Tax=Methylosinus trichosporium (strain ATCC 35070 / NCIMB 11131 / UNIQEM 75 / OB3b) TaxID=595536 RepID=A0A2D2D6X4_METT3|nr:hypothetical protein CQW49_22510 [Methylosinus trichosporium OB3b]
MQILAARRSSPCRNSDARPRGSAKSARISKQKIEIRTRSIGAADLDSCCGRSSARYAENNRRARKDVII